MLLGRGGCQIKNKILHQRTYSQMARRYNRQGKEGLGRSSPSTSRPKNIPFRWKASPTRNGPPGWSTRLRVMEWAQGGGLVDRNFLTIELIGAGEGNIDSQWNIDYEFPDQSFNCLPLQLNKRNGKKLSSPIWKIKSRVSRGHCRTLGNGWTSFGFQANFPTSMDTCGSTTNCRAGLTFSVGYVIMLFSLQEIY